MDSLKRLGDPKIHSALGLLFCVLAAALFYYFEIGETLSRDALDHQFTRIRQNQQHSLQHDVVIVGIDDEAIKTLKEPYALWHPHFGRFLKAMAQAKPAVLGLDIAMPERGYKFLIPQYDQSLLEGLQALKGNVPVVMAQMLDDGGAFRPVFAPYVEAAGAESLASVVVCPDEDGYVRRFDPNRCTVNARGSMLVEKMAAQVGHSENGVGLIDFTLGEKFDYIPFLQVLVWQEQGDVAALQRTFGGKPALLGVMFKGGDRVRTPVPLAAWDPLKLRVPGVLMQGQILRSMLNDGLIREVNPWLVGLLMVLSAVFWLGRMGWIKLIMVAAFPVVLWLVASAMLDAGWYLPIGGILWASGFAVLLQLLHQGVMALKKRHWLRGTFGSYVSQEVLQQIMTGQLHSGLDGSRTRLCILFADIHGFASRSETRPATEVVALLNDYFSEMTLAIHQHQGTVDKFIGDGVTAFFGAPLALATPEKNALEAAQEMLQRVRSINARLQERGLDPIEIGIALHVGEVVVGHIGTELRHEYTAIGDVVSMALRLEELSKSLHFPVVCSAAVAKAVEQAGGLSDCGEHVVKGVQLRVFGWNPPVLAEQ